MGGSLTIFNRSNVHVVVTLKNAGLQHCKDVIKSGGSHDYDLAKFDYDIYVEGADDNTLQDPIPRGSEPRIAYDVPAEGDNKVRTYSFVKPCKMEKVGASKSRGQAKAFYIHELTLNVETGVCQLALTDNDVPCASSEEYSDAPPRT